MQSMKHKGDIGETIIIDILKKLGVEQIRRPDICFLAKDKWFAIEVKNKEPYEPPPDYMQGIPMSQYIKDLAMSAAGLTCILVVRGKNHEWLAQSTENLKPRSDPRTVNLTGERLAWFELSQFKPLFNFLSEVIA